MAVPAVLAEVLCTNISGAAALIAAAFDMKCVGVERQGLTKSVLIVIVAKLAKTAVAAAKCH